MPSNYTPNYSLNQWAATDKVERVDFNADNAKIDTALAGKADKETVTALQTQVNAMPRVAVGTFQGNDRSSRFIGVGFTPKAVYLCTSSGTTFIQGSGNIFGGLAVSSGSLSTGGNLAMEIVPNGFRVYQMSDTLYNAVMCNYSGNIYYYIAIA